MDHASLSPEEFSVLDGEAMSTLCMRHGVKVLAISDENTEYDCEIPAIETLLCSESAVPATWTNGQASQHSQGCL